MHGNLDRELIENRSDVSNPSAALLLKKYAEESTIAAARAADYKADDRCRNTNGFMQEVTLLNRLFGYRSRWTPAGEWRW